MPADSDRIDQIAWDETRRLEILREYELVGLEADEQLDEIVKMVASICEVPTALISLVDEQKQWFMARTGMNAAETDRSVSFCDHAMRGHGIMVVEDTHLDERFSNNNLVTGSAAIRFYAGAPLIVGGGIPLGALCVIDTKPRPQGLTPVQSSMLKTMAIQVVAQFELRRALKRSRIRDDERKVLDRDLAQTALALAESEAQFRAITDSMPQMVWSTLPDGFHDYYNARWYEFTGVEPGSTDGEGWSAIFHPEDQPRAWEVWRQSLATGEPYEIEYRLRRNDGVYRWTLGRAMPVRNAKGEITRWFGTCTDIEDLKRMEQTKDLLSQELSHRIKNIFAVVSALISLSAREHPESRAFAAAVRERIGALAHAHEFVRPHSSVSGEMMTDLTLHAFLGALFQPYVDEQGRQRVSVTGQDALFDDQAATSVALLFHELATNAAKYGGLSTSEGHVSLHTEAIKDRFVLTWREHDGPEIQGEPDKTGFGSSLAKVSVEVQLGGHLNRVWHRDGLEVTADLPATALSRRKAAASS